MKGIRKIYIFIIICIIAIVTFLSQCISFNTQKIIFESNRTGLNDLYVVNSDGSGLINLTNTSSAFEYSASWSPDGQKVVYVSDPRSSENDSMGWDMKLMIMDQDGTNKQILDENAPIRRPRWSPSGNRILYEDFCMFFPDSEVVK